jgi:hypothetical protein
LLKEVTEAVNPPRTLFVDRPLGFPLGLPNNPGLQKQIIRTAFQLLTGKRELPVIEDFREQIKADSNQ